MSLGLLVVDLVGAQDTPGTSAADRDHRVCRLIRHGFVAIDTISRRQFQAGDQEPRPEQQRFGERRVQVIATSTATAPVTPNGFFHSALAS